MFLETKTRINKFLVMKKIVLLLITLISTFQWSYSQDYYYKDFAPFDQKIPAPEAFLEYGIGSYHTRHDLIVAYLTKLAEVSDRASIETYGKTHEGRKLVIFTVTSAENQRNLEDLQKKHLELVQLKASSKDSDVPVFVQLGYNVHGNEPSSSEAAMLTAYVLTASTNSKIENYIDNAVFMIDPAINPDGRDRHTHWANVMRAKTLSDDPNEAEHNEAWPGGRTNHYWFDLNRDWFLGTQPESVAKLEWYHQWYPNVVTDFHEMGTNSTHFFEPMKPIGSKDPIMPKENYEDLNDLFATYFRKDLDSIGSLYFTKEAFDGTYPGYGSSYPDLQGGLALLFEQASSRGHLQKTDYGKITFAFTIRNQFTSSMATIRAAVENRKLLRAYQQDFFRSAVNEKPITGVAAYSFDIEKDQSRTKAFVDHLLSHKIEVYKNNNKLVVPMKQPQRRMIQNIFETYSQYRDSVFYDASAWSTANFYNMNYRALTKYSLGDKVNSSSELVEIHKAEKSSYAYLISGEDYLTSSFLYDLQSNGLKVSVAHKPFKAETSSGAVNFGYGTLLVPVSVQDETADEVFDIISGAQKKYPVSVWGTSTGFSLQGIDLGSRNFIVAKTPKVDLLVGEGVRSYEAGEVWHLLDTRVKMPISKLRMERFSRYSLDPYNTLIMVSGSYSNLDSIQQQKIAEWVKKGNTLITIAGASKWAIDKKLVKEALVEKPKNDENVKRLAYVDASEHEGKKEIGGAFFKADLDLSHPIAFGYIRSELPVYKNNNVFIQPSKNPYATVSKYLANPHIDGYVSQENLDYYFDKSAPIITSSLGRGTVVLFGFNPNFRATSYGSNKLFLNAIFYGSQIKLP